VNSVEGFPRNQPLRPRIGQRPMTSKTGPHKQLTDNSPEEIWNELVSRAFELPDIERGKSSVSLADSIAGLLLNSPQRHGEWSLAFTGNVEPFHVHGMTDASIHLVLPSTRAREIFLRGWGEPHTFADFDTQVLIYAPRDESEILVALQLIRESRDFALESLAGVFK
jgi:hypothetical protein